MNTKIGVLINFNSSVDITAKFQQVKELELQTCQVNIWDTALYTDENAEKIINASKETGIENNASFLFYGAVDYCCDTYLKVIACECKS